MAGQANFMSRAARVVAAALAMAVVAAAGFASATAAAYAQEQGYWRFVKALPATMKPVPPDPNNGGLEFFTTELADGSVEATFRTYKDHITTRSSYSAPPTALIPGQKVTFHLTISRVENTWTCCSFGNTFDYYYNIDKNPSKRAQIAHVRIVSGDDVSSNSGSGVMTVPFPSSDAQARAEESLWLSVSVSDNYVKYFQYAWTGGSPPANAQKGDFDAGLPNQGATPIASNTPNANGSTPVSTPNGESLSKACPNNPPATELQVCHIVAKPDASVMVPVYLLKSVDLAALNFELSYDPAVIKLAGNPTYGPAMSSPIIQPIWAAHSDHPGNLRVGFVSKAGGSASGVIMSIPFSVIGPAGSRTTLELKVTTANGADGGAETILIAPGDLVVEAPPPPPPPPPPVFSALDAMKALQMSVGMIPTDMKYDVDKNGQVTANDARLILQQVVAQ